jgi:hypothetical protein
MATNYTQIAEAINEAITKAQELQQIIATIELPPYRENTPIAKCRVSRRLGQDGLERVIENLRLTQMYFQDVIAADATLVDATTEPRKIK